MANDSTEQESGASNKRVLAIGLIAVVALAIVAIFTLQPGPGLITLPRVAAADGITTFADSGNPVELEDGKPVIRLFSTTWCPHCTWISETYERVVNEYVADGKIVARHWELDIGDDTLSLEKETVVPESELAAYKKFNPRGTVPTFVFGGKYSRVGNGFERENDLAAEEAEFRAVIEALLKEAE